VSCGALQDALLWDDINRDGGETPSAEPLIGDKSPTAKDALWSRSDLPFPAHH